MPTSFFFKDNKAKSEGVLLQSLVDEAIKIHGIDVYYLPARRPNLDQYICRIQKYFMIPRIVLRFILIITRALAGCRAWLSSE